MNQRSCGHWEPNLGPLEERKSLLLTETHFQAQFQFYYERQWFLFVLFKNIFNSADFWSHRKLQSCCRGVMHIHHSPFPKGHTFHNYRTVSTLGIQHCYFYNSMSLSTSAAHLYRNHNSKDQSNFCTMNFIIIPALYSPV